MSCFVCPWRHILLANFHVGNPLRGGNSLAMILYMTLRIHKDNSYIQYAQLLNNNIRNNYVVHKDINIPVFIIKGAHARLAGSNLL